MGQLFYLATPNALDTLTSAFFYFSIASDGLKGRVYEVSLADLQNEQDAERSFKKFKLVCEEVRDLIR